MPVDLDVFDTDGCAFAAGGVEDEGLGCAFACPLCTFARTLGPGYAVIADDANSLAMAHVRFRCEAPTARCRTSPQ